MLTTYRKIASIFLLFITLIGCMETDAAEVSYPEIQVTQEDVKTVPVNTEGGAKGPESNDVNDEIANKAESAAHEVENFVEAVSVFAEDAIIKATEIGEIAKEEKSAEKTILWQEKYRGRLSIPDVGIDVALYYCPSLVWEDPQYIVDAEDSAVMECFDDLLYVPGGHVIADHSNQGFDAMKSSIPYETRAYIKSDGYSQEYICVGIGPGVNTGPDLVDWNGVSLNYDYITGDLAMYTCNNGWQNIIISYWQSIEDYNTGIDPYTEKCYW